MIRVAAVIVLGAAQGVTAGVYTYECDSFPDDAGWTLNQVVCEAWQELDGSGHLLQHCPSCADFPCCGGQFDYAQLIGDLSQETAWFAEWRVQTDGPSTEIPYVAPAHLLIWDGNALVYHFTIADDQFRLIANDFSSLHDLEAGPHTFRVELFGDNLGEFYAIYVDGEVIFSGVPVGPLVFPPFEPEVKFRSKSREVPSTTTWDYIRWGHLPAAGSGDFDSNGEVDSDDFYFFQECLETEAGNWAGCAWADFDSDSDVDCDDWAQFELAWTDPGDPPAIAQCASTCPADLDGSDTVDAGDLALLLGAWGPGSFADLNGDDLVNASDLAELLGAWGTCQ